MNAYGGHHHLNNYGLLGPLEYAVTIGDTDMIKATSKNYSNMIEIMDKMLKC